MNLDNYLSVVLSPEKKQGYELSTRNHRKGAEIKQPLVVLIQGRYT
jgi:hypothetical protein